MITGVCFIFLHGWGSCASPAMQKNETHPDNRALSGVGFLKKENKRVGAGAAWSGVGALVAARRASWRVGPSPCGRPQGPHTQSPRLRPASAPLPPLREVASLLPKTL